MSANELIGVFNMMNGTLEITTKIGCKVNCKFCPQNLLIKNYFSNSNDASQEEYLSLDNFKKIIDKVPKSIRIDFSGMCEPWLNPECTEMIKYASEKGHKIAIFTTLVGITIKDIEIIEKLNLDQIVIHIADKNSNSNIQVNDSYKQLLERLIHISNNCNKGISCHGELADELHSIITDDWSIDNNMIDRAGNLDIKGVQHQEKRKRILCSLCGTKLNHNVLLPNGLVLLCCMDYGMKHILGNLLNEEYEDIMNNKIIKQVKDSLNQIDGTSLCHSCSNAIEAEEIEDKYLQAIDENRKLWDAKQWLNGRLQECEKNRLDAEKYIYELEKAKEYFINQAKLNEATIEEQSNWILQLEEAKKYWQKQFADKEQEVKDIECSINDLEKNESLMNDQLQKVEDEVQQLKSEVEKYKYKLNTLKNDNIISKVIKLKKLSV